MYVKGNNMTTLIYLTLNTIAVFVAGYILPGITIDKPLTALVVAVVLGFINATIRPLLILLTLPINILTLGLFTLVIMGLMVMLTSAIVPGFTVASFPWAIAFALVFAILNNFLYKVI